MFGNDFTDYFGSGYHLFSDDARKAAHDSDSSAAAESPRDAPAARTLSSTRVSSSRASGAAVSPTASGQKLNEAATEWPMGHRSLPQSLARQILQEDRGTMLPTRGQEPPSGTAQSPDPLADSLGIDDEYGMLYDYHENAPGAQARTPVEASDAARSPAAAVRMQSMFGMTSAEPSCRGAQAMRLADNDDDEAAAVTAAPRHAQPHADFALLSMFDSAQDGVFDLLPYGAELSSADAGTETSSHSGAALLQNGIRQLTAAERVSDNSSHGLTTISSSAGPSALLFAPSVDPPSTGPTRPPSHAREEPLFGDAADSLFDLFDVQRGEAAVSSKFSDAAGAYSSYGWDPELTDILRERHSAAVPAPVECDSPAASAVHPLAATGTRSPEVPTAAVPSAHATAAPATPPMPPARATHIRRLFPVDPLVGPSRPTSESGESLSRPSMPRGRTPSPAAEDLGRMRRPYRARIAERALTTSTPALSVSLRPSEPATPVARSPRRETEFAVHAVAADGAVRSASMMEEAARPSSGSLRVEDNAAATSDRRYSSGGSDTTNEMVEPPHPAVPPYTDSPPPTCLPPATNPSVLIRPGEGSALLRAARQTLPAHRRTSPSVSIRSPPGINGVHSDSADSAAPASKPDSDDERPPARTEPLQMLYATTMSESLMALPRGAVSGRGAPRHPPQLSIGSPPAEGSSATDWTVPWMSRRAASHYTAQTPPLPRRRQKGARGAGGAQGLTPSSVGVTLLPPSLSSHNLSSPHPPRQAATAPSSPVHLTTVASHRDDAAPNAREDRQPALIRRRPSQQQQRQRQQQQERERQQEQEQEPRESEKASGAPESDGSGSGSGSGDGPSEASQTLQHHAQQAIFPGAPASGAGGRALTQEAAAPHAVSHGIAGHHRSEDDDGSSSSGSSSSNNNSHPARWYSAVERTAPDSDNAMAYVQFSPRRRTPLPQLAIGGQLLAEAAFLSPHPRGAYASAMSPIPSPPLSVHPARSPSSPVTTLIRHEVIPRRPTAQPLSPGAVAILHPGSVSPAVSPIVYRDRRGQPVPVPVVADRAPPLSLQPPPGAVSAQRISMSNVTESILSIRTPDEASLQPHASSQPSSRARTGGYGYSQTAMPGSDAAAMIAAGMAAPAGRMSGPTTPLPVEHPIVSTTMVRRSTAATAISAARESRASAPQMPECATDAHQPSPSEPSPVTKLARESREADPHASSATDASPQLLRAQSPPSPCSASAPQLQQQQQPSRWTGVPLPVLPPEAKQRFLAQQQL